MGHPEQETTSPGTGDLAWWSGKANPDSTGDAAIALGHAAPIPFMPLSQKGTLTNGEIRGHWGAACIHSEGPPLGGG